MNNRDSELESHTRKTGQFWYVSCVTKTTSFLFTYSDTNVYFINNFNTTKAYLWYNASCGNNLLHNNYPYCLVINFFQE
jgi:hypothetical protein